MKASIFSLFLLAVIILGCVFSLHYTRATTDDILDTLDICQDAVTNEKWELATDSIYLANSLWNHYRPLYSTFLRHDELTEITGGLSRITMLVNVRNRDDFLVENGTLCELIKFVAGFDRPTFENLF